MKTSWVRAFSIVVTLGNLVIIGFPGNPSSALAGPKSATLSIATKAVEMAFDKVKLTATPGQTIKLVFLNKAAKDSGLQHNWVLVNPGKADEVGQAAMAAGPDKAYIPDSKDVLAHTKLLNGGDKDTIEFTAPVQAGDYPYICTFPGHYMMMKGVLSVK